MNSLEPPPSPIPTGKGSRSAGNEIFSEYLQKSIHVPELSLPEPHVHIPPLHTRHQQHHHHHHHQQRVVDVPVEEIDYRSLESGDSESVDRLVESAMKCGVFRITGHGIFGEELAELVEEGYRVLPPVLEVKQKQRIQIGAQTHPHSSKKMNLVASKLDSIARQLCQVLVENSGKDQFRKRIQGKEHVFSLCRYNHANKVERNSPLQIENSSQAIDYVLCLHLPTNHSRFLVQSAQGPLSFDAGPDTIIVTIGQRAEEWSMGHFKCVSGKVNCEPRLEGSPASLCIELECLSLGSSPNHGTITIRDQILFGLFVAFLYKVFAFFSES